MAKSLLLFCIVSQYKPPLPLRAALLLATFTVRGHSIHDMASFPDYYAILGQPPLLASLSACSQLPPHDVTTTICTAFLNCRRVGYFQAYRSLRGSWQDKRRVV